MDKSSQFLKFCFVALVAQLACAARIDVQDGNAVREFPCPIDEDILPCVCTYSTDLTEYYLDCSDAKSEEELSNVFYADFPFTNFVSLTIDQTNCDDCAITALSAGALGNLISFEQITITGTQIASIEEEVFGASHDTLLNLHLQSNRIRDFPFESLGDYVDLRGLYLQGNQFDSSSPIPALTSESLRVIELNSNPELIIPPDFVKACPSIQRVLLRNGKLTEVPIFDESPIGMFTELPAINTIDFSLNRITEIQSNTIIANASTLVSVNFSQNNISILHPDFVRGFSSSADSKLYLQQNSISLLDQQIFEDILKALPTEGSVDLSENPILCGCEIAWLVLSSPDLRVSLTDTTTCEDGVTVVKELVSAPYENC